MYPDSYDRKQINIAADLTKQRGIATLVLTVILLVAAMTIIIYATNHSVMQQKTATNQYANSQAYSAAEAGLEYGFTYLQSNWTTVVANPSDGFINYSLGTTTLANNTSYSITFTNPTANNYTILTIISTGTSVDGTSTKTVQQQVTQTPPSLYTVTTKGNVNVNGSGGGVSGSYAVHTGGSADPLAPAAGGQILENDQALHDISDDALFQSIFGVDKATKQSASSVYSSGSVPWSTLTGSVWVNGDVSQSGTEVIGSIANPIILIINGNYTTAGQFTVYGVVYVTGDADLKGNSKIIGALITEGDLTMRGNGAVNYNNSIITQLLGGSTTLTGYAKIPGSWKDF